MRDRIVGRRAAMVTSLVAALLAAGGRRGAAQDAALDAATRARLVERVAGELERGYVFPEVGAAMARRVRERLRAGAYDALAERWAFADSLTADLKSVSHDGHLRVATRGPRPGAPAAAPGGGPPSPPRAVARVERLAGNVGYLKIDGFPPLEVMGDALRDAMRELAGTDALIVDLRDNRGGAPESAMALAGYLVARRTLVARIYSRQDESTTEMWTGEVPGPRYLDKPVYLLTSRTTFSAGEAAAYHLKHMGRARTVGDSTGGGAHRIRGVDLDRDWALMLPYTRPINVVTNGDWEGTGVVPDIAVPAPRALDAAHLAALRALPSTPERAAEIRKLVQTARD